MPLIDNASPARHAADSNNVANVGIILPGVSLNNVSMTLYGWRQRTNDAGGKQYYSRGITWRMANSRPHRLKYSVMC